MTMIFGVEVKGDHTFDRDSVERYIEQAHKYGQEDERAKIVAWLKMVKDEYRDPDAELADRVEAGEHLK